MSKEEKSILEPELTELHMLLSDYSDRKKEYVDYCTTINNAINEGKIDGTNVDIVERQSLLLGKCVASAFAVCDYLETFDKNHMWGV